MNDPIQALKDAGYHVVTDRPISKRFWAFVDRTLMYKDYLRDPLIIRLLSDAQLRKGNTLTAEQMIRAIKPGEDSERFVKSTTAISNRIFHRGFTLECQACSMLDWYPLQHIVAGSSMQPGYKFVCFSCESPIYLPVNVQFEFKLNALIREAVKDGGLTLLNTLVYLLDGKQFVGGNYSRTFALEVKNRYIHTDIDLLIGLDQDGMVIECKDNFQTTDSAIAELQRTIETGLMLADTLGYQYVFATLQDEVPLAIQQPLDAANARLLTAGDLLKPYEG